MVNRRTVIKQFLFVASGVVLLPACFQEDQSKASMLLKNFQVNGQQEKNLAELADTIIPATDTPGAKAVSAHLFMLKMLDDCYKKEDQQKFMLGLEQFEKAVLTKYNKPFAACSRAEREAMVATVNNNKNLSSEMGFFYATAKKLTIQAYTTSKFYLTQVQVYKMIPGKYKGCVPVTTDNSKKS